MSSSACTAVARPPDFRHSSAKDFTQKAFGRSAQGRGTPLTCVNSVMQRTWVPETGASGGELLIETESLLYYGGGVLSAASLSNKPFIRAELP